MNGNSSSATQADAVRDGRVDTFRIEMPSFNCFRDSLGAALNLVC